LYISPGWGATWSVSVEKWNRAARWVINPRCQPTSINHRMAHTMRTIMVVRLESQFGLTTVKLDLMARGVVNTRGCGDKWAISVVHSSIFPLPWFMLYISSSKRFNIVIIILYVFFFRAPSSNRPITPLLSSLTLYNCVGPLLFILINFYIIFYI